MSTETTNKKIKIDNGTTFGRTYTDKAVDERLQGLVSTATFTPVKEKANNSLQKPSGLTKTKLVGVGTNGQENIEIGDNLTLANGKLSATGGVSGGSDMNVLEVNNNTFTGFIDTNKINLIKLNDNTSLIGIGLINFNTFSKILFGFSPDMDSYRTLTGNLRAHILIQDDNNSEYQSMVFSLLYYSHFITLSSPTLGSVNFNFYDKSFDKFTIDRLKNVLSGKYVTCSGYIDDGGTKEIAQYIAGEAGGLNIGWFDSSDGSTGGTQVDNTFSISDDVSQVE